MKIKNSSSSRRRHGSDIVIEYYQDVPYDMVGGNSDYVDLGLGVNSFLTTMPGLRAK